MHELVQQLKAEQLEEEEVVSPAVALFVEQVEIVFWLQLAVHLDIRVVKVVKYDRFVHEPLVLVNDIDTYWSRLDLDRSIEDDIVDNEEEEQHVDDV